MHALIKPEQIESISKYPLSGIPLSVLLTSCEKDPDPNDPIKIADQSFINALFYGVLDENGDLLIIDTDGNHNISYVEAEAVTYLNVGDQGITDLSGIEAFINLEYLLAFRMSYTTWIFLKILRWWV